MLIKVLFAQEKDSYPEEYAPIALEVVTEYDYDENPEWFDGKLKKYQKVPEYLKVAVLNIRIKDEDLDSILFPKEKVVAGKVVKGRS